MTATLRRPQTAAVPAQDAGSAQRRKIAVRILAYVAMVLALAVVVVPLYWIVMTSFKERSDIYVQPVTWWPGTFHPENYREATTSVPVWMFLRNSVIITTILAAIKFVLGTLSAYGLVLLRFPG